MVSVAPWLYLTCIVINGICTGANFVLLPAQIGKTFGSKTGPLVWSFALCGTFISSLLNLISSKTILDEFGFAAGYSMSIMLSIGSLAFVLLKFRPS